MCLSVQALEGIWKEHTAFLSLNSPLDFIYLFIYLILTADVLPVVALLFILKGLRLDL